jgi:hypothetical protein
LPSSFAIDATSLRGIQMVRRGALALPVNDHRAIRPRSSHPSKPRVRWTRTTDRRHARRRVEPVRSAADGCSPPAASPREAEESAQGSP